MSPGWYPDETDPSQLRWWNGTAWSDGVQQPGATGTGSAGTPRAEASAHAPVTPLTPVLADEGGVVGLSSIGGFDASENETTQFVEFKNGQWYKIRLRVT